MLKQNMVKQYKIFDYSCVILQALAWPLPGQSKYGAFTPMGSLWPTHLQNGGSMYFVVVYIFVFIKEV